VKILSPRVHGYLDYLVVLTFALAPSLFRFGGTAAIICYSLAGVQLVMSLLTAYPISVAKIIPFTVHGALEAIVAVALIAMPWLFGFHTDYAARNFFIVAGVGIGIVWVLTDYKAEKTAGLGMPQHRPAT
jgi:hypothetical protein